MIKDVLIACLLVSSFLFVVHLIPVFFYFLDHRREMRARKMIEKEREFNLRIQSIVADLYLASSAHDVRLRKLESNQKNKQVNK